MTHHGGCFGRSGRSPYTCQPPRFMRPFCQETGRFQPNPPFLSRSSSLRTAIPFPTLTHTHLIPVLHGSPAGTLLATTATRNNGTFLDCPPKNMLCPSVHLPRQHVVRCATTIQSLGSLPSPAHLARFPFACTCAAHHCPLRIAFVPHLTKYCLCSETGFLALQAGCNHPPITSMTMIFVVY